MCSMTVSFYSNKHHDSPASAIKAQETSPVELACNPTLNQLLLLVDSVCQCAGTDNNVGIIVDDATANEPENSQPGLSTRCVWLYNQQRNESAKSAIARHDVTQVEMDYPMTLNELLAVIDSVTRYTGGEDVVGIAEPMFRVVDCGYAGKTISDLHADAGMH